MKNIPKTRRGFEQNMGLLEESFHRGTIRFNHSLHRVARAIQKTRILPNQRVDMISVNETSRLQANSIAHFSAMINKGYEQKNDE